jgi:hypothetical protein
MKVLSWLPQALALLEVLPCRWEQVQGRQPVQLLLSSLQSHRWLNLGQWPPPAATPMAVMGQRVLER